MLVLFLRFIGVVFASYGAYLYFDPQVLIGLIEMGESTATKIEVRAMYGGLQLGFGLLLLWAAQRPPSQQQVAYAAMIACFAGLASGRAVGMLIEGGGDGYNTPAFIFESASLLVSVYGFRKLGQQASS